MPHGPMSEQSPDMVEKKTGGRSQPEERKPNRVQATLLPLRKSSGKRAVTQEMRHEPPWWRLPPERGR